MHLPDGIIPLHQAFIYWIITLVSIAIFFFRLSRSKDNIAEKDKRLVISGVLAAGTIFASSITIPSPFGIPMHFFMIPLVVIILGPFNGTIITFLSLLIQSMMGLGGLTVLGVNTVIMGVILPIITYLFYFSIFKINENIAIFTGTLVGIFVATIAQITVLIIAGAGNLEMLVFTLLPFYLFVGVIEGFITTFIISFIGKINPEILKLNRI